MTANSSNSLGMKRKPGKSVQNVAHAPERTHTYITQAVGTLQKDHVLTSLGEFLMPLKSNVKHAILSKLRTSAFSEKWHISNKTTTKETLGCSFKECQEH